MDLNILDKSSDVQERHLNRSSHLLIGCIHEHFQGTDPILVILPQLVYLISSCILPKTQRKAVNGRNRQTRSHILEHGFYSESKQLHLYMFDFDEQLPPSPVQKKQLLLEVTGDCFIAGLDEEVSRVVHVHVLLHPVREVSEKVLEEKKQHSYLVKQINTLPSPVLGIN